MERPRIPTEAEVAELVSQTGEIARGLAHHRDQMREAIQEAFDLFKTADDERLNGVHEAHAEAQKWKAEGDMYGWNFHQGKAGGMTEASIIFNRAFRRLKAALEAAD